MIEEAKEATKTFFARTREPFIGAFTLCSLLYNWRILFVLFNFDADCTLDNRISIIQTYLPDSGREFWWHWIIGPTLSTFGVFLFYQFGKTVIQTIARIWDSKAAHFPTWLTSHIGYINPKLLIESEEEVRKQIERNDKLMELFNREQKSNTVLRNDIVTIRSEWSARESEIDAYQKLAPQFEMFMQTEIKAKEKSLSTIMLGQYVCRWVQINDVKNCGSETFVLSDEKYVYLRDNSVHAIIKNVYYLKDRKFLYFEKHFSDGRAYGKNYLTQLDDDHFIGLETTDNPHYIEYHKLNLQEHLVILKRPT